MTGHSSCYVANSYNYNPRAKQHEMTSWSKIISRSPTLYGLPYRVGADKHWRNYAYPVFNVYQPPNSSTNSFKPSLPFSTCFNQFTCCHYNNFRSSCSNVILTFQLITPSSPSCPHLTSCISFHHSISCNKLAPWTPIKHHTTSPWPTSHDQYNGSQISWLLVKLKLRRPKLSVWSDIKSTLLVVCTYMYYLAPAGLQQIMLTQRCSKFWHQRATYGINLDIPGRYSKPKSIYN